MTAFAALKRFALAHHIELPEPKSSSPDPSDRGDVCLKRFLKLLDARDALECALSQPLTLRYKSGIGSGSLQLKHSSAAMRQALKRFLAHRDSLSELSGAQARPPDDSL